MLPALQRSLWHAPVLSPSPSHLCSQCPSVSNGIRSESWNCPASRRAAHTIRPSSYHNAPAVIHLVLNDLCCPAGIFPVLLLKVLIQIVNLYLFVPRARPHTIQRKTALLCLIGTVFLCDYRINQNLMVRPTKFRTPLWGVYFICNQNGVILCAYIISYFKTAKKLSPVYTLSLSINLNDSFLLSHCRIQNRIPQFFK